MKRLLLILVLCLSGIAIMKGEQLVATLQSGDATKVFYGQSAFVEAYAEASDGDVITLSKGNFKDDGVTIEKSITLRGAGAFIEGESTVFQNLAVTADRTIIEGIKVTGLLSIYGNKQQLLRCYIETLNSNESAPNILDTTTQPSTTDIYIGDCAIKCDGHALSCVNGTYINCAIGGQAGLRFDEASATYVQCVMYIAGANLGWDRFTMYRFGYFYNCILFSECNYGSYSFTITTPNQFYDTIIYKWDEGSGVDYTFEAGVQRRNCVTSLLKQDDLRKKIGAFPYFFSEGVTAPDVEPFVCGVMDHKEWPVIPRVVESNIDRETDASGHLKVDVKVSCEK